MTFDNTVGRRGFLAIGIVAAWAFSQGAAADETVCAKSYAGDKEQRDSLHYVEQAADPARPCETCMYFESRGHCGNCRILETLVNPAGSCDSWSKKAE